MQATRYMRLAKSNTRVTFRDLQADATTRRNRRREEDREVSRMQGDEIARMRELAHELITTGFRALAIKLHPDHPSGSLEAMARLNRVRDGLVRQVRSWLGREHSTRSER
jgi:hypothetical protein